MNCFEIHADILKDGEKMEFKGFKNLHLPIDVKQCVKDAHKFHTVTN